MSALCSATSLERAEPMTATASRVGRWLLVEHPGAWGPESVPSRRMAVTVARALARTANEASARLLLIRRSAGQPRTEGREVFAVDSRPGGERLWRRHLAEDAEWADLRAPYDAMDPAGWEPRSSPLYLVCTHGRHDRCCALLGRPVAKALSQRFAEQTWECTHIGGDRFAANVLVLPEGLYLGRIEAAESVRVMDELAAGLLPAGRVRGRSSRPLPTQAAQQFAREATGRWGVTDLLPLRQEGTGPDTWSVRLAGPGGPGIEVVVRYDRSGGGEQRLTCDALELKPIPLFRQMSLHELPADPGPPA